MHNDVQLKNNQSQKQYLFLQKLPKPYLKKNEISNFWAFIGNLPFNDSSDATR